MQILFRMFCKCATKDPMQVTKRLQHTTLPEIPDFGSLFSDFFSIIILITQTHKTKNMTIYRYYFIFPVPRRKEKNNFKQSEIEVKMIIRMKKHNLSSNWQIVFMSDTDKQTLIDL